MEQGIIDNVVSKKALDQLDQLTAKMESALSVMEKLITKSATGVGGSTVDTKAEKELIKLQQETEKLNILEQKRLLLSEKVAKASTSKTASTIEEKVALQSLTNIQKLNAIVTSTQVSAFERLVASQKLAAIAAQEAGLQHGMESKQFADASIKANKLAKELTTLSSASGNMGRSGMNNAYNSTFQLTQVMRELPNFAIDARVGFMSLSNNLPMLADGFKQLSNSVDAAGKKIGNVGALKIFAKSLLSLNTVMIVAVTLMTLFGDKIIDWIGNLFKGSKAVQTLVNAYGELHAASLKGKEDAQSEITKLDLLHRAAQNVNLPMEDRKKAVDELQRKYPKYLGNLTDEAILLGKDKKEYQQLTRALIDNAIARASLDRITDNAKKILTIKEQFDWRKKFIDQNKQEYDTYIKTWGTNTGAEIEFRKKMREEGKNDTYYKTLGIKLAQYGGDLGKLEKQEQALVRANTALGSTIKVGDLIEPEKVEKGTQAVEEEVSALELLRNELQKLTAGAAGSLNLDGLEQRLQSMGETLKGLMSADQLAEYEKFVRKQEDDELKRTEKKEQTKQKIISASLDTIMQLYNIFYNSQADKIKTDEQSQLNALERRKNEELNAANLTADEKTAIEEQYDYDRWQIQKDAFDREKQLKIQAILIDAAMGEVRLIAENAGNVLLIAALSTMLAATTAASIAQINSSEYPAFAEGGEMPYSGLAWVGDGGRQEGVTTPSGFTYVTPDVPTLTYLEKGTKIVPDASMLTNDAITRMAMLNINQSNTFDTTKLEKKLDRLIELEARPQKSEKKLSLMEQIKIAERLKLN